MKTLRIIFNCIVFVILTSLISCEKFKDEPEPKPCDLIWSQTFGNSDYDMAKSVQQTTDGGYILTGCTYSYGAGSNKDAWLIKTDAMGTEQWSQTFGGSSRDGSKSVQQTTDGGYILAGWTESYGTGNGDAWLIKTDATGTEQWSQTFGGSNYDVAESVQQTTDGGYILAGGAGNNDAWLIKTDATGTEQWSQTFGGFKDDVIKSVQQTTDGGYILAGYTNSYGNGNNDAWLIKTDATGTEQWSQTFGGSNYDVAESVQQTTDGGYILTGKTLSFETGDYSDYNAWLIKTDAMGTEQWSQTFGGYGWDIAKSVQQTIDGGYILAGYTNSYGAGSYEAWLIKTDATGTEQWSQTFGGSNYDIAESVQQTMDGNYILAGWTKSYGAGDRDAWLIKVEYAQHAINF